MVDPIDVLHLAAEPTADLRERVDPDAMAYLRSRTEKDIVNTRIPEPKRFHDDLKRLGSEVERLCKYAPGKRANGNPSPLWAPHSTQFHRREIRNLLLKNTHAIRMRHADLCTLLWICNEVTRQRPEYKMSTRELGNFVRDPEDFIEEWRREKSITTEHALHQLSQVIRWAGDSRTGYEPYKKLNQEVREIVAQLRRVPEMKWAHEMAEERKATIAAVLIDAVITNLTWAVIRECESKGWPVSTCVHDRRERGFNAYRDADANELVRTANE
eukprot:7387666-Prymnesium_polylepis.1